MPKVLIVDDQAPIRRSLRDIIEMEKGFKVDEAADGLECIVKIKKDQFDVIIMDIKMPKMDGMEALERIQLIAPQTPVIMVSGHANIDTAVEAVKKGAFDFVQKPLDVNRILITIRNALDKSSLITETKTLKRKVNKQKVQEIIGTSDAIQSIKHDLRKVGPSDARVLITGPNGSGKELVARWVHEYSKRSGNPLVEVNCAAIPAELIESELFGHEKGSFTSAHKMRTGKFEQANGGTLFLDEIGDMSLSAQAKVLRALENHTISRVGSDKLIRVDVRVVAATNKNLPKMISEGNFREDLYHRLAVILMHVPPLNDRREDIPALVTHFAQKISAEHSSAPKRFTDGAYEKLKARNWTGNVRELRNVVERLMIMCGDEITGQDVDEYAPSPAAKTFGRPTAIQEIMKDFPNPQDAHNQLDKLYSQGTN